MKWKHNKWIVALAVLVMIAVFTVPHSKNGSEYDYAAQELSTGRNAFFINQKGDGDALSIRLANMPAPS